MDHIIQCDTFGWHELSGLYGLISCQRQSDTGRGLLYWNCKLLNLLWGLMLGVTVLLISKWFIVHNRRIKILVLKPGVINWRFMLRFRLGNFPFFHFELLQIIFLILFTPDFLIGFPNYWELWLRRKWYLIALEIYYNIFLFPLRTSCIFLRHTRAGSL